MGVMAYKSTMNLDFNEIVKSIAEPVGECYNNWGLVRTMRSLFRFPTSSIADSTFPGLVQVECSCSFGNQVPVADYLRFHKGNPSSLVNSLGLTGKYAG